MLPDAAVVAVRRDLDVGEVRPEELQEEVRAGVEHAQDLDVHTLLRPVQPACTASWVDGANFGGLVLGCIEAKFCK